MGPWHFSAAVPGLATRIKSAKNSMTSPVLSSYDASMALRLRLQ